MRPSSQKPTLIQPRTGRLSSQRTRFGSLVCWAADRSCARRGRGRSGNGSNGLGQQNCMRNGVTCKISNQFKSHELLSSLKWKSSTHGEKNPRKLLHVPPNEISNSDFKLSCRFAEWKDLKDFKLEPFFLAKLCMYIFKFLLKCNHLAVTLTNFPEILQSKSVKNPRMF